MAEEKELLTISLRDCWKVPRTQRVNRAIKEVRSQVARHAGIRKEGTVWLRPEINELLWARSRQKPPRKITVQLIRDVDEDGKELVEVAPPEG